MAGKRSTKVDATEAVNEYINKEDWRINANANTNYSHASLINNLAGKVIANYWLDAVYSKEEGEAHRNGDYHIHDLDALSPYCCGHDFQKILDEGFNGVIGRVGSKPPKHFREALYQLANYFGILQAEWAGAQAVSSFDTYLAPHVFFDTKVCGLTYDDIKKAMRNFVFNLNVPSRWGQCVPESYKCLKADGTWVNYKDLKVGDEILVIDMETGKMKPAPVTHVNVFDSPKKLHRYTDGAGFNFEVTPNHRMIYLTNHHRHHEYNNWDLKSSEELLKESSEVTIPTSLWSPLSPDEYMGEDKPFRDCLLELATIVHFFGKRCDDGELRLWTTDSRVKERVEDICEDLDIEIKCYKDEDKGGITVIEFGAGCVQTSLFDLEQIFDEKLVEFLNILSPRQLNIIIDTWNIYNGRFDGNKWTLIVPDKKTQETLAAMVLKTGKGAECYTFQDEDTGLDVHQVYIYKRGPKTVYGREVESTHEKVWCPTTDIGTFVCMTDEGQIFFTGNSPFTNVTIDWTVPNLMKDLSPSRGGKNYFQSILDEWAGQADKEELSKNIVEAVKERFQELDPDTYELLKADDSAVLAAFTYKFFQKEMNTINKAFYEVLNEGDMLGQPFTFPIPTINITEDFEWDGENADLLFENTAKYGSSYFQNFIGSQYMLDENGNKVKDPNAYTPNDVRSMCPLALDTPVITNHGIKRLDKLDEYVDRVMLHGQWYGFRLVTDIPKQRCLVIELDGTLSDGKPIQFVVGEEHLQPVLDQTSGTYVKRPAKYITEADMIPVEVSYDATADQHIQPIGNRFQYGRDRLQYIKIKSITEVPSEPLMCIEVNNEEHNFTLGNGVITSNCRLQLDKKQLRMKGGGLFGSDSKTGSIGVVTINCPRLGYLYKGDKEKLYKKLDQLLDMAKSTLEKKRKFVIDLLERGLYPYTRRYIGSFDTYFSTIGVNGVNEMIRNFTNDEHNITDKYGQDFAKELLKHIREILVRYQEETGNLYNLEATPAEGTMRRFAHSDIEKYPDIIQAGFSDSLPYYTNSTQLPVEFTADAFTALDLQDDLQKQYTGGCVFHVYTRERVSSAEACKRLVRTILSNYRLPYISITPTFSVCPIHGRIEGEHEFCPKCDQELIRRHAQEVDTNL